MTPQCNIDAKGKAVRLLWGVGTLLGALVVTALKLAGWLNAGWWWVIAAILAAFGVLGLYEARKGWCVVRAMGFKTPI